MDFIQTTEIICRLYKLEDEDSYILDKYWTVSSDISTVSANYFDEFDREYFKTIMDKLNYTECDDLDIIKLIERSTTLSRQDLYKLYKSNQLDVEFRCTIQSFPINMHPETLIFREISLSDLFDPDKKLISNIIYSHYFNNNYTRRYINHDPNSSLIFSEDDDIRYENSDFIDDITEYNIGDEVIFYYNSIVCKGIIKGKDHVYPDGTLLPLRFRRYYITRNDGKYEYDIHHDDIIKVIK